MSAVLGIWSTVEKGARYLRDIRHHLSSCLAMPFAAGALVFAPYAAYYDRMEDWPAVGLFCFALVALLGTQRFEGLHISSKGVGFSESDADSHPIEEIDERNEKNDIQREGNKC